MRTKHNIDIFQQRLLTDTTPFAIREAFNHLRTNLMYTRHDKEGCPIFAVTSVVASAGKSTVLSNIAVSYAMASKKVLLIDADMRAPMQYRIFETKKKGKGLSDLLSGLVTDDSEAIVDVHMDGLYLLPAGIKPPDPSELIMSNRFETFLKKWSTEYDVIFIDFPPIGIVTDALTIHDLITGYILVTRSGKSDARSVRSLIEDMRQLNANIVGVVLNDIDAKAGGYTSHYYGRYGRYYGYGRYGDDNSNNSNNSNNPSQKDG